MHALTLLGAVLPGETRLSPLSHGEVPPRHALGSNEAEMSAPKSHQPGGPQSQQEELVVSRSRSPPVREGLMRPRRPQGSHTKRPHPPRVLAPLRHAQWVL